MTVAMVTTGPNMHHATAEQEQKTVRECVNIGIETGKFPIKPGGGYTRMPSKMTAGEEARKFFRFKHLRSGQDS